MTADWCNEFCNTEARVPLMNRVRWGKSRRCAICGETENLQGHCLNYRNLVDVRWEDLRLLCPECHKVSHDIENDGTLIFLRDQENNSRFGKLQWAVRRRRGLKMGDLLFPSAKRE